MAVNVEGMLTALESHALRLARFERVNRHEPKSAPGKGLTVAIWADKIQPFRAGSGLNATSALVVWSVRIYSPMIQDPMDALDPNMVTAVDALLEAYSGDFDLGGSARNVDLLGEAGGGLSVQAGYVSNSGTMFRVMTISVPVIVNDAWTQGA